MRLETLRSALLWCALLNYGVLPLWVALYLLPGNRLFRLWSRWFRLSREQFDAINFAGIVADKVAIIGLNLVPLVALWIVG